MAHKLQNCVALEKRSHEAAAGGSAAGRNGVEGGEGGAGWGGRAGGGAEGGRCASMTVGGFIAPCSGTAGRRTSPHRRGRSAPLGKDSTHAPFPDGLGRGPRGSRGAAGARASPPHKDLARAPLCPLPPCTRLAQFPTNSRRRHRLSRPIVATMRAIRGPYRWRVNQLWGSMCH